jgi:PAS domain S-box-containing protein
VVSYNATTFYDQARKLRGVFAAARDITEHKKLEQQLRDQQYYLRGLIESSVDGLITVDPDGYITDINDRMCQMTGYVRAELLGTPFSDYFTEPERASAGVRQTLDAGAVTEYALTLVARSRRLLQVSFNASVFKDPAGNVRGILASARDVTDRVRLEEQLRDQQTYLRGLIESSVDGLITVDQDGFITDVNEQMCRMSGYGREVLIGSAFKQYFTEPGRADAGVKRTLTEGVVTNYELILKSKTGRKATVSFNASVFRSRDGRLQGIFASARDISEQARLQGQLAEQQAYNRSLIEASPDALFAIAPGGTVTDVNEEATRITGYSRKHLVNSMFSTYFTDPEQARSGVKQTFAERRVIGYELTLITRYGRRLLVSFNAGVFSDAAGSPLGILAAARDITAQKELEGQLRDSQFYTRSLIESNIDALMTTDPLGVITDINQQMETLTGRSREELIGSPFKQYFTDPARAEHGIRRVLEEGRVTNYELTACNKDGRQTVVSYNAVTFYDRDNKLQGVFAAARDVTERKRAEDQFRKLLESAPDAMVIVNRQGQIVLVNTRTEQLFGYRRDELLNQSVEILVPERFHGRHVGHRSGYTSDPRVRNMGANLELHGRRKDGTEFPVEISLSPLETEEGTLVTSAIRDVTERERFVAARKRAEDQFRKLLEAAPDAMVIVNRQGQIVLVNTQTEHLFGYQRDELLNQNVEILVPERFHGRHVGYRSGYTADPRVRPMGANRELHGRRKDGEEFPVEISLSPLETEEGTLVTSVIRDVTERKRFEQTLQEKNIELENASLAKDRFLASMSHELRTPLNAIIGFTGTLLMKLPGPLTADQDKQLKTVRGSARHLLSLINDLLDLAKIESGKVKIQLEEVPCQEILTEVAASLRPLAEQKGLEFVQSLPDSSITVKTDRRAISQIVINLLNNAIKFTNSGSVRLDLVNHFSAGSWSARISVADTGVGIRPEDRAKLFQAFEQVENTARAEGTGLGLYLSQKLAQLIGARIEFESEYGQGSRFTLVVPLVGSP